MFLCTLAAPVTGHILVSSDPLWLHQISARWSQLFSHTFPSAHFIDHSTRVVAWLHFYLIFFDVRFVLRSATTLLPLDPLLRLFTSLPANYCLFRIHRTNVPANNVFIMKIKVLKQPTRLEHSYVTYRSGYGKKMTSLGDDRRWSRRCSSERSSCDNSVATRVTISGRRLSLHLFILERHNQANSIDITGRKANSSSLLSTMFVIVVSIVVQLFEVLFINPKMGLISVSGDVQ